MGLSIVWSSLSPTVSICQLFLHWASQKELLLAPSAALRQEEASLPLSNTCTAAYFFQGTHHVIKAHCKSETNHADSF